MFRDLGIATQKSESKSVADADPDSVTALLVDSRSGDEPALNKLVACLHDELREMARRLMLRERCNHTLQATALVHETYLKLMIGRSISWQDRRHFLAICARAMRQVLVQHAETKNTLKRGGERRRVPLEGAEAEVAFFEGQVASTPFLASGNAIGGVESAWRVFQERSVDLLALDEALDRLARLDARQAKVVELRFFGGLSVPETAQVIGMSERTVEREWRTARAWLRLELGTLE